jgi:nicotinamide-nucleotide adenylyltransferase
VREVAAAEAPTARLVHGPARGLSESVTVLSGAFDPPTRAHTTLARAARRGRGGAFLFSLAARTIDKDATPAALALRLRMLTAIAVQRTHVGVVVCNRGLYVDQAEALRELGIGRVTFVIGFDKVPQLFDARYYEDREAALKRLFTLAKFLVVARDGAGVEALARFMALPDQCEYAGAIEALSLTAPEERALRDVSSTRVRALRETRGDWQLLVPREIWPLVRQSSAYGATPGC